MCLWGNLMVLPFCQPVAVGYALSTCCCCLRIANLLLLVVIWHWLCIANLLLLVMHFQPVVVGYAIATGLAMPEHGQTTPKQDQEQGCGQGVGWQAKWQCTATGWQCKLKCVWCVSVLFDHILLYQSCLGVVWSRLGVIGSCLTIFSCPCWSSLGVVGYWLAIFRSWLVQFGCGWVLSEMYRS